MQKIDKQATLEIIEAFYKEHQGFSDYSRVALIKAINALPVIGDGWVSVLSVPLNVEVISLDTMTGEVKKCKYIRQPDAQRASRYFYLPLPPNPLNKTI